ncbi:chondroitin sulfate proteoglycan 4 [Micractinium conductrix]|uniref:Chondroitin sulfate proteoglycan 4 n=1 Tax=Micractinium conductrix TaxID=554055 RepID=A0A2P6VG25_9CHLO|nr:chondroitin sulfate proteoglycan 4 [Micractinium conductrix]|eukprot:PSC73043.1 chondroitin sulfate proteoglycan 4 [Micractinium conductrix]
MESLPSLLALPEGVLAHVLGSLSFEERRRATPLVCRHLQQLADSPALNAAVSVSFGGPLCLPRLRSFCQWLGRHCGSLQQLRLELDVKDLEVRHRRQASVTLGWALAGCGFQGSLRQLQLTMRGHEFPCSAWAARLPSLRALALNCGDDGAEFVACVVEDSLQPLTQLQDLWLGGFYPCFAIDEEAALPLSLTRLHIDGDEVDTLPLLARQLSATYPVLPFCS